VAWSKKMTCRGCILRSLRWPQIALDVLKAGGSAADAAIAANAAQGLMEPTGNGIGGDLFAIVYDAASNEVVGLNGSGRSPKGQSWEEVQA